MDLRQLRALVAVADHESFSAAARSLHTVQSNVSTHIARLERELRVTLVDRANGQLTPEGMVVVSRARRIDHELAAIDAEIGSLVGEVSGTVSVGVIGTTARWLVPDLLQAVGDRYPKIRLILVDATTSSLLPQVTSGRLDSAVVNLPVSDPDIDTEILFEEDPIVVAPQDHPLAELDEISLEQLAAYPLLLGPPGTSFRDTVDAEAAAKGIALSTHAEVDGMRLLASLAFQGYGAALLPASAAPSWLVGAWKRVRVDGLTPRAVGLAISRRSAPPAPARAVREILRGVVAASAPHQLGIHLLGGAEGETEAAVDAAPDDAA
jgi:LysR family hydrogen peroxide-inducible transcriptional activator